MVYNDINSDVLRLLNKTLIVYDTETTGLSVDYDWVVEVGAIKLVNGKVVDTLEVMMNPMKKMGNQVIAVHGITNEMVASCPTEVESIVKISDFFADADLVCGHNVQFDNKFMSKMYSRYDLDFDFDSIDTCGIARKRYNFPNNKLITVAEELGVEVDVAHRALADVVTTLKVLKIMSRELN